MDATIWRYKFCLAVAICTSQDSLGNQRLVYFLYQWRRSGVFIVNFEHISHLVLVFLLLTLNM